MITTKETIKRYINEIINCANDYLIIVLGNVKNVTKDFSDYKNGTSVISDFYSLTQFNAITECLIRNNLEVLTYFDEMDFIYDYLDRRIRNNYPKKFIVLNFSQKGTVQGRKSLIPVFCEMNDILHTNSNGFASSFAREKYYWNLCLKHYYSTPKSWAYGKNGWLNDSPDNGTKIIVKLPNQSSSIGLDSSSSAFIYDEGKEIIIREMALRYNETMLVQQFISGMEAEVPVFNDGKVCFALPPAGIMIGNTEKLGNKFLDYDMRGNQKYSRYNFKSKYSELADKIMKTAVLVAKFLDLQGICRIDFRIDALNTPYITDINCSPHLTEASCISKSMNYLGFNEYESTILALLGLTINRQTNEKAE